MGFIKFIFKIMGVFTIWQLNSINNQAFKCFLFPWRWILFYILLSVYCSVYCRYYDTPASVYCVLTLLLCMYYCVDICVDIVVQISRALPAPGGRRNHRSFIYSYSQSILWVHRQKFYPIHVLCCAVKENKDCMQENPNILSLYSSTSC